MAVFMVALGATLIVLVVAGWVEHAAEELIEGYARRRMAEDRYGRTQTDR